MPQPLVPHLALLHGDTVPLAAGFEPDDILHVVVDTDDLQAGQHQQVLGYRLRRDNCRRVTDVTAYVPGRQLLAIDRQHLRYPDPAAYEVVFAGMLPVTIREIEVDVYAEALRLERPSEARVVALYGATADAKAA